MSILNIFAKHEVFFPIQNTLSIEKNETADRENVSQEEIGEGNFDPYSGYKDDSKMNDSQGSCNFDIINNIGQKYKLKYRNND